MRTCTSALLVGLLLGLAPAASPAQTSDDTAATVAAQKKAGAANWDAVVEAPHAFAETKHLLIYAPKTMEKRLGKVGAVLEKYHSRALDALAYDPKGRETYPGKIAVYLFADLEQVPTFARRVEKRRPLAGETGSFSAKNDRLHAVAAAGGKGGSVESRAGEQVVALLLTRKAGIATPVPDWVLSGFGRATSYRVLPREKFVLDDRKQAKALASKRKASDVWGGAIDADEAGALSGSVMDFLAYGPGSRRFPKFIEGFQPGEGATSKTAAQAMETAGIKAGTVEKVWKTWVASPR